VRVQIRSGQAVTIAYTIKDEAGKVLETREGGEPLTYLQGGGNVVVGLQKALEGKRVGEKLKVSLSPGDAYGLRDDTLIRKIPLRQLQVKDRDNVVVGGRYRAWMANGSHVVYVTAREGNHVVVDGNHPLAGVALHFEVEVIGVRDATAAELAHGHVHGPDSHH
jgi:FKBP-type peptidyl-prolyl cis-trans isomerase SlyD